MFKKFKMQATVIAVLILTGSFVLQSCETAPLQPQQQEQPDQLLRGTLRTITSLATGTVHFLIETTQYITKRKGGTLSLLYDATKDAYRSDSINVVVNLDVPENSLPSSMTLSVAMNKDSLDKMVDLDFGPDGTVFNKTIYLDITASKLNLSGVNPDSVGIFYWNPDNGSYEAIPCHAINVNLTDGTVEVIDAEINHFSRYVMAYGW